jgi:hypothetical protein
MAIKLTESRLRQIIREEVYQLQEAEAKETAAVIKANPEILVASEDQVEKALKDPKVVELIKQAAKLKGITPEKAAHLADQVETSALSEEDSANATAAASLPAAAFATMFAWSGGDPKYLAAAVGSLALGWLLDKVTNASEKSQQGAKKPSHWDM